jgi:hypothetical protein
MKLDRQTLLAALIPLFAGCAVERSEGVETEMKRLTGQASDGVSKVSRALANPWLASSDLGEGLHAVESTARSLGALEVDERANDFQQLMAIVQQARVWDDVAHAFASAPAPPELEAEQRALLGNLLDEKAFPARAQAASSYQRARARACRSGYDAHPVMLEIADGLARYGDDAITLDRPCAGL